MADWRPIDTADTDADDDVLVSDGVYVTLGWYNDTDGRWYDSTRDCEYVTGTALEPQPVAWQPKPQPPAIASEGPMPLHGVGLADRVGEGWAVLPLTLPRKPA